MNFLFVCSWLFPHAGICPSLDFLRNTRIPFFGAVVTKEAAQKVSKRELIIFLGDNDGRGPELFLSCQQAKTDIIRFPKL